MTLADRISALEKAVAELRRIYGLPAKPLAKPPQHAKETAHEPDGGHDQIGATCPR